MAPVLGSRTTALQALRGADLTGKTAILTGKLTSTSLTCRRTVSLRTPMHLATLFGNAMSRR